MYFVGNRVFSNRSAIVIGGLILAFAISVACGGAAAPVDQSPAGSQTGVSQAPVTQAPVAQAPVAQAPVAQAPVAQAPVAQATSTPAPEVSLEISRALKIVTFSEEIHLDYMDGNSGPAGEHFRNSFTEPLIQRITGSSELKGLSAESWEAVDGDPAHWRFKIRQGIEFHNGEKFDAHAAVTDINFIKLPERGMIYSESVGGDHEVVAVDDYTLDLICEGPCPLGPTGMRFTHFAAPDWYTNASEEERKSMFITSGPFKFVEWQRGVKIVAEPFENYWQGEVKGFPEVTIFWRDEDTVRAAMVQTGEVDWAFAVGPQNFDNVPKTVIGESSEVVLLKINSKNREPFKEPKVRLALRHVLIVRR